MFAVPIIKSHFASSNVSTPGFAAAGGSTPVSNSAATPSNGLPTNFFTNASSSYQSHFGDFSSSCGVNAGIVTNRSSSSASAVSAGVAVVGSGVPPPSSNSNTAATAAKSAQTTLPASAAGGAAVTGCSISCGAPAPIGTTPATTVPMSVGGGGGSGSPCSAPLPICERRSTPSSRGNSPHTLSIAPTVKFASPMAVGTSPKTASTLASNNINESNELPGTEVLRAVQQQQEVAAMKTTAPTPAAINIHSTPSNSTNSTTSTSTTLTVAASPTGGKTTTSTIADDTALADMDEDVLKDAHNYAMLALSTTSGNGGIGGVSLSPTSPAIVYSGTLSPMGTTPRVDLRTMSPTSFAQLSAQQQQLQTYAANFSPTAPLTPLSAQSSSSHHSNTTSGEPVVDVYDSDFKTLLSIPAAQVTHRPHPSLGVSRLVLCRNYSPENPGNCTKGELCKFVHADITNASRCSIHVNYAWRSLDLCAYPRLPPGDELTVLAPNERQPSEVIPSERILITRGSTNWRKHTTPLSHCAHYYFNRMCNRGERCNFIHAVHVDPNVQGDFKRAPAPTAVAPIVTKPPTSPALRGGGSHDGSTSARSPKASVMGGLRGGMAPPPSPPPLLPPQQQLPCGAFGFAPSIYPPPPPPPPPGPLAYPLLNSPTAGSGPYMMFSSGGAAAGFVPATLVPPPPSHLGDSNGVYLLVPAPTGMGLNGSATPGSPVSPLGQSLGSLSNGPIDWSFYGDLDTAAWMPPPSPSTRM
jgi:hypothetical protein